MSLEIKKATRVGIIPLIAFYGKSGSGKSMSALLYARGLVGPQGRIVAVDTENRRLSLYADVLPGGYSVIDLDAPFSPDRYREAIEMAEANADVMVIDSLSHEHAGEGGVLEMQEAELDRMAGDDWKKREACKMASWIKPKLSHKKLVARILRCRVPVICCLRADEKTHMVDDPKTGRKKVVTDEFTSPQFDPKFIYETLICYECFAVDGTGGFVINRKHSHPSIIPLLPKHNEQIGIAHGEALAQWCASPGGPGTERPATGDGKKLAILKKEFFTLTMQFHGGDPKALQQWAVDECLILPEEQLSSLTVGQLEKLIVKTNKKLEEINA